MPENLTTIPRPKYFSWPTNGLVQLGPAQATDTYDVHDVFLNGIKIGQVQAHENIPGARPAKIWVPVREAPKRHRFEARWAAVRQVVQDHLGPDAPFDVPVPRSQAHA